MKANADVVLGRYRDSLFSIVERHESYGMAGVTLIGPPRRLYADGAEAPPLRETWIDAARVIGVPSPAQRIILEPSSGWVSTSGRAIRRLQACFLIAEDPAGRFVERGATTLAHQVSLVRHILEDPDLERVMIADEVGLGKTIEAGLIIKGLLEQRPNLRVLYLAPARLVTNVHRELVGRLGLPFRKWAAGELQQADLAYDPLIVASIHRAAHPGHRERVASSGPWDVLIVDECHHLTAHGTGAQSANEQYRLVRALAGKLQEGSRMLLLSGTPHQGNRQRFEHLLAFLAHTSEGPIKASRRVIFRTKEDVRDWGGQPLFPPRDVHPPTVVTLGEEWRSWYDGISTLYDTEHGGSASRRANTWARGQALQWAASSVEAGLGFLARLAVRRLSWGLAEPELTAALLALRPYKGGAVDETAVVLLERVRREIARQQVDDASEDAEELDESKWQPDDEHLRTLLSDGCRLLRSPSGSMKWDVLKQVLTQHPSEKIVLFAQPVETVAAVVRLVSEWLGQRPSVIIGGQNDTTRDQEIQQFRRADGPRVLVSSRAGGEGINLQVARRLIHLDVPWNPMEMEQRVGRIHRFGSAQTVVVDTIVVEGTREVDAYRYARDKLRIAFADLAADPQRFEALYARVMTLVPPEQFEEALAGSTHTLSMEDKERLGAAIDAGRQRWAEFNAQFRDGASSIASMAMGAASWDDVRAFALAELGATPLEGITIPVFQQQGSHIVTSRVEVPAVMIGGSRFVTADTKGVPATDSAGVIVENLAINVPILGEALRNLMNDDAASVAWLRADHGMPEVLLSQGAVAPLGFVACLRQRLRAVRDVVTESACDLELAVVDVSAKRFELRGEQLADVIRWLSNCVRQRSPSSEQRKAWGEKLVALERARLSDLTRPASPEEFASGIRHAAWPVFAAVLE